MPTYPQLPLTISQAVRAAQLIGLVHILKGIDVDMDLIRANGFKARGFEVSVDPVLKNEFDEQLEVVQLVLLTSSSKEADPEEVADKDLAEATLEHGKVVEALDEGAAALLFGVSFHGRFGPRDKNYFVLPYLDLVLPVVDGMVAGFGRLDLPEPIALEAVLKTLQEEIDWQAELLVTQARETQDLVPSGEVEELATEEQIAPSVVPKPTEDERGPEVVKLRPRDGVEEPSPPVAEE